MSKMMVVVFDDEAKAYEGSRALMDLHREGSITAYAGAVISRDSDGKVRVKEDADEGPIGTALGMMTGAMIGILAGAAAAPVGAAAGAAVVEGMALGAATGTVLGATADLINLGVGTEFLDDVATQLAPGKTAVVAEVEEYWQTPVDTRMEGLGGTVHRRYRADVEDEQIERDIEATRTELQDLKEELEETNEENKAKVQAKIDAAKARLEADGDKAKAKVEALKERGDAKVKAVEAQIATARDEAKAKLEERKAKIKSDYAEREAKMKQAWELTKEALT
jgi:uncharacterized membrane protein